MACSVAKGAGVQKHGLPAAVCVSDWVLRALRSGLRKQLHMRVMAAIVGGVPRHANPEAKGTHKK